METEIDSGEKQYDKKMKDQLRQVNKFVQMQVAMIKEEQEREQKAQQDLDQNMMIERQKGAGLERDLLRKERLEDLRLEQNTNKEKITQLNRL